MHSEQSESSLVEKACLYCGASVTNCYRHDENCIINVPIHHMESWRMGWRMKQRVTPIEPPAEETPLEKAFLMGVACAKMHGQLF